MLVWCIYFNEMVDLGRHMTTVIWMHPEISTSLLKPCLGCHRAYVTQVHLDWSQSCAGSCPAVSALPAMYPVCFCCWGKHEGVEYRYPCTSQRRHSLNDLSVGLTVLSNIPWDLSTNPVLLWREASENTPFCIRKQWMVKPQYFIAVDPLNLYDSNNISSVPVPWSEQFLCKKRPSTEIKKEQGAQAGNEKTLVSIMDNNVTVSQTNCLSGQRHHCGEVLEGFRRICRLLYWNALCWGGEFSEDFWRLGRLLYWNPLVHEGGRKKIYMNLRQSCTKTAYKVKKVGEVNPRCSCRAEGFKNLA